MSDIVKFDVVTLLIPSVTQEKEEILAASALIGVVKTSEQNAAAVDSKSRIKKLTAAVEKQRKVVKTPFLDACMQIDAAAKNFTSELDYEYRRLDDASLDYLQDQRRIAEEKERIRQAEISRIEAEQRAEQERINRERREAEERQAAEMRRIAVEASKARSQADLERLAQERAKAKSEAEARQIALDSEAKRQEELARQEQLQIGTVPVKAELAKGQSITVSYDFEVVDILRLSQYRPDLVKMEPKRREILDAIKDGKPVPGLRVFQSTKENIRPTREPKAIDI
jgi:DNA repair exonuclease SbcCD ATPase subunit